MKTSFYVILFFAFSYFSGDAQSKSQISITSSVGKSKIKLFESNAYYEEIIFCGLGDLPERIVEPIIENGDYNSIGIAYSLNFNYFSISSGLEKEDINYSISTEGFTAVTKMNRFAIPINFIIESPSKFGPFASIGMSPKWTYKTVSSYIYHTNDSRATINIINTIGLKYIWNKLKFRIGYNYQNELKNDNTRLGLHHTLSSNESKIMSARLNASSLFLSIGYEI